MPDVEDLARRAVACRRWRWLPGMRLECGDILLWSDDQHWHCCGGNQNWIRWRHDRIGQAERGSLPDLTDPATLGCLLALVREAWGDPSIIAEPSLGMWEISRSDGCGLRTSGVWGGGGRGGFVFKPTEVDALVTALEVEGELTARGLAALKAAP